MDSHLNPRHKDFFKSTDEDLIFYGGANAGKSYSAADKCIVRMVSERRRLKGLVVRKSLPSLKRSCLAILQQRLALFKLPYNFNRLDMEMSFPDLNGSQILFLSVNNISEIEKVKSITDVDFIWEEEANELMEEAHDALMLRLRGGEGLYKQTIRTFNPIGKTSWIFKRDFEKRSLSRKIHVTVDDNPYAAEREILALEALKDVNINLYRVYRLGEWGSLEGQVYPNWRIIDDIPAGTVIEQVIYGLDFGYVKPAALVQINIAEDGSIYLREMVYETELTTPKLIQEIKNSGVGRDIVYADNEDPGRIEEISQAGIVVLPAEKNIEDGVSFVQGIPNVNILAESVNLIKEWQSYCNMRDKNGNWLDKPVKYRDHLMDAVRYGAYTHRHSIRSVARQKDTPVETVNDVVAKLRPIKGQLSTRSNSAMAL